MDELFGELRSLLQTNTIEDESWRVALCGLLEQGWSRDPKVYQAQWLPYLSGIAQGWSRRLRKVESLEELERWAKMLPGQAPSLSLHYKGSGMEELLSSAGLSSLGSLLIEAKIGDEGVLALCGSPHLAQLHELDLSGNGIGTRGAIILANSEHLASLRWLQLWGNHTGEEGRQALAHSPYLCEAIREQWK